MSNSIHFEQLFERFSRFLDRQFRPAGERRRGKHGCGFAFGAVTTAAESVTFRKILSRRNGAVG